MLVGGVGIDSLTGGSGVDTFAFLIGDGSAATSQHDQVSDFTSGIDRIDLSGIDAITGSSTYDLFHFIGSAAFDGVAGALDYFFDAARGVTVLQGDTNGDRIADFAIDLSGNIAVSTADLSGIALTQTVIESAGSTSLTAVGNQYYLYDGSGSGPSLNYAGTAFVAGQFDDWTPIGAEQTANGYMIAWKFGSTDQYTVWSTDSSGNYTSNIVDRVSGNSGVLETIETTFDQDLNSDGTIGIPNAAAKINAGADSINSGGTTKTPGQDGESTPDVAHFMSGQDSAGWHFDSFSHSGSGGKFEQGPSSGMPDSKLLTAPLDNGQVDHSMFQSADGNHEMPDNHDAMTLANATTLANAFLADLHAGHFIIH